MSPSMLAFVIVLFFMPQLSFGIWKDCGSKLGAIKTVKFVGCEDGRSPVCKLKRGTNVTASVTFTTKADMTPVASATTKIHAIIVHIPIPWSPSNVHACRECGLVCPLKPGKEYTYSMALEIKKFYPSVRAIIEWAVADDKTDDNVFCFEAPIAVV